MNYVNKEELKEKIKELQRELNKLEKEELPVNWKPKVGHSYYALDASSVISTFINNNDRIDQFNFKIGNYFKSSEEAEERLNELIYTQKYVEYVESRSDKLDWKNNNQSKCSLYYDYEEGVLGVEVRYSIKGVVPAYASDKQILMNAIEELGKDNIIKYVLKVKN